MGDNKLSKKIKLGYGVCVLGGNQNEGIELIQKVAEELC